MLERSRLSGSAELWQIGPFGPLTKSVLEHSRPAVFHSATRPLWECVGSDTGTSGRGCYNSRTHLITKAAERGRRHHPDRRGLRRVHRCRWLAADLGIAGLTLLLLRAAGEKPRAAS